MEYFSMLIGYNALLILVIVFYACAMILRGRRKALASIVPDGG